MRHHNRGASVGRRKCCLTAVRAVRIERIDFRRRLFGIHVASGADRFSLVKRIGPIRTSFTVRVHDRKGGAGHIREEDRR